MNSIPEQTEESLTLYVEDHQPPGGFLRAVLENNLREAVLRADEHNRAALVDIVCHCYGNLPAVCWGSPEKVKEWLEMDDDREPVT